MGLSHIKHQRSPNKTTLVVSTAPVKQRSDFFPGQELSRPWHQTAVFVRPQRGQGYFPCSLIAEICSPASGIWRAWFTVSRKWWGCAAGGKLMQSLRKRRLRGRGDDSTTRLWHIKDKPCFCPYRQEQEVPLLTSQHSLRTNDKNKFWSRF